MVGMDGDLVMWEGMPSSRSLFLLQELGPLRPAGRPFLEPSSIFTQPMATLNLP
jgi:hypothetical protein